MITEPKFVKSEYFYISDKLDKQTNSYWRIKEDAPVNIQKDFFEWRQQQIEANKKGVML